MSDQNNSTELLKLTAEIVAAHVSNNSMSSAELPQLISQVHASLSDTGRTKSSEERPAPAVPIKKSVLPSHIICLEDGKKLKMLKRHLNQVMLKHLLKLLKIYN